MPTDPFPPASSKKISAKPISVTPTGYRMPAEWSAHEATWLTWPKNRVTWPGRMLAEVEEIYLRMIAELLAGERVHLLVPDFKTARSVQSRLERRRVSARGLICHAVKTVDTWIRDYGPIFVTRTGSKPAFVKWIFNAWGGKYADLARDNRVVDRIEALQTYRRFDAGIVLEGGSIDVNGRGDLLTTEQCLLRPTRNPGLTKKDLEAYFRAHLGVRNVIWLKDGIEGDDTDGHVDDITRFVGPRTILTALESDPEDRNQKPLAENLKILRDARGVDGKRFRIVELPMPGYVGPPRSDSEHNRLPASYANFYVGNACVLVPVYSHRNDKIALGILRGLFPDRKVVGIECTALVYGLGSIHCVSQQQPAG